MNRLLNILLIALATALCLTACQDEQLGSPAEQTGRLLLTGDVAVTLELADEGGLPQTRTALEAITPDDFTYTLTNLITQEVYTATYAQLTSTQGFELSVGEYTLQVSYGENKLSEEPYFYYRYDGEIIIQPEERTSITSFQVPLACAVIQPNVSDELLAQFKSYTLTLGDGTTALAVTNHTDYFVPVDSSCTFTIDGTNQIDEQKQFTYSVNSPEAKKRYLLNCTAALPTLTMPDQPDYNAWSYHVDVLPATITVPEGLTEQKVRDNMVYEYSTDQNTWTTFSGSTLSGLTPNTTYYFRARFGIISSNVVSMTTEDAAQIENGNMDSWESVKVANSYSGEHFMNYYVGSQSNHIWFTNNDATLNGATTHAINNVGTYWRWCAGTINTTDAKNNYAAEISTLAFCTKKITGTNVVFSLTSRSNVYNDFVKPNGQAYIGQLYLGDISYGISHTARPKQLSFYYKYSPVTGDNAIVSIHLFDKYKNTIFTRTINLNASDNYNTPYTIDFDYTGKYVKSAYLSLSFVSGTDLDISKMQQVHGTYDASPYSNDRVVGSVLKIDEIMLIYD